MSKKFDVLLIVLDSISEISDIKKEILYFENMEKSFEEFARQLVFPISVICETSYVDAFFRDCYYNFFASKHSDIPRNCQRIALFQGNIEINDFYNNTQKETLQSKLIGTIVIRPLKLGTWGRTLIDPQKLHSKKMYVRTTTYHQSICGMDFTIDAYPFSSQDSEMTSCAETSIWTMLNYYGTRYPEYRTVLPSEIISEVNLMADQRSLPTLGLNYLQKSNLLKKFGFSPVVYSREIYGDKVIKRLFHYYVESGIPFTISLNGHSTVCIGHACAEENVSSDTIDNYGGFDFIDSSDLHSNYVIIDDNQYPYKIEKYDDFSIHKESKMLLYFTVPLHKRIFLEASAAEKIFDAILKKFFLSNYVFCECFQKNCSDKRIIKRIFLTSSRKYKSFRMSNKMNDEESQLYLNVPFPKFLWVMELSDYDGYFKDGNVFGEMVLDATSGKYSGYESVIAFRVGQYFSYRLPNETFADLIKRISGYRISPVFKQYINNLNTGGIKNDNKKNERC